MVLCFFIGADYIHHELESFPLSDPMVGDRNEKSLTRAQKKNMKKKQKKKESKIDHIFEVEEVIGGFSEIKIEGNDDLHVSTHPGMKIEDDCMATKEVENLTQQLKTPNEVLQKRIRTLKKKIKQIEELETRLDSGEILEKEQLEKISKKDYFMEELSTIVT